MSINAHPELPEFDYVHPSTMTEASRFLFEHAGEAVPFLGGTDIFVCMRDGFICPRYLVDVKNLNDTGDLRYDPQQGLAIGAGLCMNRVISSSVIRQYYPLLAEACFSVASYQLRSRATIVGNLCNASPAGDTIGACLVLDGCLEVHGVKGIRTESLETFFRGPGQTVLLPGDIVTTLHFPPPPEGTAGIYLKLGRNALSDLSIVGVTAYGFPDSAAVSGFHLRVALASVAPVPLLLGGVEQYLMDHPISKETIQEAARMAEAACSPIDDVRGSAAYRRAMVRSLTTKALKYVWQKLTNNSE